MNSLFRRIAHKISDLMGSPWAFMLALSVIGLWALSGSFFQYSDTWQLVINTSTTIVTFLMVFLIQNAQNRDAKALHIKLDEIISALQKADDQAIDLEDGTDEEMEKLRERLIALKNEKTNNS